jgi:AcrR family transcriptional regulator
VVDRNSKNSKQVILDAATQVFAEKGFDGSRVDEIARRAGVNKALLYYYFESKDKILEELMVGLVEEMVELKDQLTKDLGDTSLEEYFDNIQTHAFIDPVFQFVKERKHMLQIITSEALKGSRDNDVFFQMIDLLMEDGMRRVKQMKGQVRDYEEFITTAFFFSLIPMLNFVNFGEKWAGHVNIDYQVVEAKFLQFFMKFYRDYFKYEVIKPE